VQDIVTRGLDRGNPLPTETEMLALYAVSRSSLREALRLLEVQGLVTIRPGPGSGTVVGQVEAGTLARTLALYMMMGRVSLGQLLDAWEIVEPMLAEMAARNPDRARVQALMAPFAGGARSADRALAAGLDFHDAVAELSGNPVLRLCLGAVGELVTVQVRASAPGFRLSDATVAAHESIADALLAGDGPGAAAAMRAHLALVRAELDSALPGARMCLPG
jgi:GntR family transcriptional regulator, transcriptional repressor for pyruvate dehydrogenase complex